MSPATITLVGRCSAWGLRLPASPSQAGYPSASPRSPRRVVMAWLHHRSYGTLGVYLTDPPGDLCMLPAARQWVRVSGLVLPRRVCAQPDDPRSASAPDLAPLAVALTTSAIISVPLAEADTFVAPLLLNPQHVRLLAGRRCGRGYLVPVAHQPDLSYWQATGTLPPSIATWNRIVGVVGTLGAERYLRYVVSAQPACGKER